MANKGSQKKSGGMKKCGRNAEKCARYRALHVREKNKLRRVLRSNGTLAAQAYALQYNLVGYLSRIAA